MTDNDIIKALECCIHEPINCRNCSYEKSCNMGRSDMQKDARDLINRQKAEIERLQHIRAELSKENEDQDQAIINALHHMKVVRAEAIKEFAESVKNNRRAILNAIYDRTEYSNIVDNLVKEMTEEQER